MARRISLLEVFALSWPVSRTKRSWVSTFRKKLTGSLSPRDLANLAGGCLSGQPSQIEGKVFVSQCLFVISGGLRDAG